MPETVITITNAPSKLRGDLTKWMQEISTGVYIGNFNSRIREKLWQRVISEIGKGQATMSFSSRNELGYEFETFGTTRVSADYDGIPLVLSPKIFADQPILKSGFSDASKFHQSKKYVTSKFVAPDASLSYVVFDIETTGLDFEKDQLIEIGAIKVEGEKITTFESFVSQNSQLPQYITELTGITDDILSRFGQEMTVVLHQFSDFVQDKPLVGYHVAFDQKFIQNALKNDGFPSFENQFIDLMKYVKREKKFLSNYKLQTVLNAYGISEKVPHRALKDSQLIHDLSRKVNGFQKFLKEK